MIRIAWKTCRWPLILFSLWMITLTGIHSIPIESHEVLVVQTTREMELRGDWVLPSFNNEPRLQKPPFNYWATAALSRLDPVNPDAQVWHGRLVSLLAGLAMVLATYHAGKTLFDPSVGKLASLMLLSMQGYVNLTHNARPDFLYSTFGALQLFAWMYAWKAKDDTTRQRVFSWLGWALAGLATLTKGPQLPFVFLAGMLAFLFAGPERKRILNVLRPFTGIVILCAIALPWWFLLQQRVVQAQVDLSQTQMSGSLLRNLASWRELLSFYYPLTLFSMMIPAGLVAPFLLRRVWTMRREASPATRLLFFTSATLLIVFTLGGHYRKHYLLPLLPAFALFLASALQGVDFPALKGWIKGILLGLLGAVAAFCLWLLIRDRAYPALAWIAVNTVALIALLRKELGTWDAGRFSTQWLKASAVLVVLLTAYFAHSPSNKYHWRGAVQSFAASIGRKLQPADRMVQWRSNSFILPLYARRPVPQFDDPVRLEAYLQENRAGHGIYAVLQEVDLAGFMEHFDARVIDSVTNNRHPEDNMVFVRIE